jgi:hypothetical protein
MDRSVLSDPAVVAASRELVCARLATYESAEEGAFLASVFRGRTGELENTVLAVLAPDGKTLLTRSGRSPAMVFGGATPADTAREMAAALKRLAALHPGEPSVARRIPYLADLRRGLNVAACDLLPLVVVAAPTAEGRKKIEDALAPLAWSAAFVGRFAYAAAPGPEELGAIEGAARREGIVVVEPDAYGLKGKALAQAGPDGLKKALEAGLRAFAPGSKDSRKHIEEGLRAGVYWKTAIPVTDPLAPKR